MNTMNLPGFTAEKSLDRIISNHRTKSVHGSLPAPGGVVPQLSGWIRVPGGPGCGACTPLTWPDGTPTGACAQECCDVLGRCSIEPCSCGGGGLFIGGWGRAIMW
jgi:hypothetical protein